MAKATKKNEKMGSLGSLSIETWQWNLRTSKKNEKKGEQALFVPKVGNGTHLHP
jgi:hypothetical protein